MKRLCLLIMSALFALTMRAEIYSMQWQVDASNILYVGQTYTLSLVAETAATEEISSLMIRGLASLPEEQSSVLSKVLSQTSEITGNRRVTTFHFAPIEATKVETITLPPMTCQGMLTTRLQQGFMSMMQSHDFRHQIPAFTIKISPMSEEAQGLAVGDYKLTLDTTHLPKQIFAGEVVQLRATCEAIHGIIPNDYTLTFSLPEGCKCYPTQTLSRTPKRYEAMAYCVIDGLKDIAIDLEPFTYFSPTIHAKQIAKATPVTIEIKPQETRADTITLPTGEVVKGLYYAPSRTSPLVGYLPVSTDDRALHPLAREGTWILIEHNGRRAWYELSTRE